MGTGQHRRKVFSMVKLHRYCGTSEECVPGRFSPIAVATVPRLRCCSVSLFVGFVYVVICTMKLSIEDHHGQQMGTNPMTRTTSPRKRNAVGFRAKQRVRAFDSAQDRVPATCSRLAASTSQPSPEGARQRHVGAPCSGVAAQVAGSLFSKVSRSRHATTVSELFWRSGGGCPSWAATCASFLAAWLRCPRQNGLAFRPSPRTALWWLVHGTKKSVHWLHAPARVSEKMDSYSARGRPFICGKCPGLNVTVASLAESKSGRKRCI
jgi:hypothetical protein